MSGGSGTGDGAERAELLGTVALLLSEVPAPDVPRIRGREHQAFLLGEGLLRISTREGEEASRGSQSTGLQVDADHLQMLADQDGL